MDWLLEVSMTKIALWIRICADDWAAESAMKASNDASRYCLFVSITSNTLFFCNEKCWHLNEGNLD